MNYAVSVSGGQASIINADTNTKIKSIGTSNALCGVANSDYVGILYKDGTAVVYKQNGSKIRAFSEEFFTNLVISGEELLLSNKSGKSKIYDIKSGHYIRTI